VLFVGTGVARKRGLDRALVLGERGIAGHVLNQILGTRDHRSWSELDVILPGVLRLPGAEDAREDAAGRALVPPLSRLEEAFPGVGELIGAVDRERRERLVVHGVHRGVVVEMRVTVAEEHREPRLVPRVYPISEPPGEICVLVAVSVRIVSK